MAGTSFWRPKIGARLSEAGAVDSAEDDESLSSPESENNIKTIINIDFAYTELTIMTTILTALTFNETMYHGNATISKTNTRCNHVGICSM